MTDRTQETVFHHTTDRVNANAPTRLHFPPLMPILRSTEDQDTQASNPSKYGGLRSRSVKIYSWRMPCHPIPCSRPHPMVPLLPARETP
jgi:hypothetical protein